MTQQDVYDAWAPAASEWSQWVKPVLFAHLPVTGAVGADMSIAGGLAERLPPSDRATALVLDLPGALGAEMAGSLLERGYRPVPLYNSCPPPEPASHVSFFSSLSSEGAPSAGPPAVDVQPILRALQTNAPLLQGAHLPPDAPPAFLLDANRRTGQTGFGSGPGRFGKSLFCSPPPLPDTNLSPPKKNPQGGAGQPPHDS